jgi:hypothetical protein
MTTISASTTLNTGYNVTSDTTGTLVLKTGASPTTAVTIGTNQVATFAQAPVLPSASIPQAALAANVAGNGPAFSAYQSSAQTASLNTYFKIQFQTKEFDTNSNFDNSTNYRFTPTVAGYYLITGSMAGQSQAEKFCVIYKNGTSYKYGADISGWSTTASALVYLNGSTDYVELYGFLGTGSATTLISGSVATFFQGVLVRAA